MARRRWQPPNQPREIALRPAQGRLSCQAGQPKVPTSIRSVCTWWFRASNVITDTVRFERSSAARGSAVVRKAETIGLEAMGAVERRLRQRLAADPTQPRDRQQKRQVP